ncbi:MAG: NAD(P)-binding protein [Acidimicrobiia bacterium]
MTESRRPSIAVLGGGMAALTAAFELSEGDWRARFDRITVYQRGWRLGGKGASSRGPHGRIEEHGLHVLLGYYEHTFDVLRRCYAELDRPRTDPGCPIRTWDEAVAPANDVGVTDEHDGRFEPWVASFAPTRGRPGDRLPAPGADGLLTVPDLAIRSLRLLADFFASIDSSRQSGPGGVYLSTSATPRTAARPIGVDPVAIVRGAGILGLVLSLSWARRVAAFAPPTDPTGAGFAEIVAQVVAPLRSALRGAVRSDPEARRTYHLVELVTANLVGIVADGLLTRPDGFGAIDHLDYREWLQSHGIDPAALDSPLLRGMYDLVFGYEDGDPERPRFAAGLGLRLGAQMLLGYSGALFWKMQAGMGEIVFAPLYQVLNARGVEFRFFHRVDALRLTPAGDAIGAVEFGVQARPTNGAGAYDPLVRVKGLPCWPAAPIAEQLDDARAIENLDFESFWSPTRDVDRRTLVAGEDFDVVVFGISLGMVPYVCADLVAHAPEWRAMVDHVATVPTQAFQLWLRADERALGWEGPLGATVSGFVEPFDTWASMTHLVEVEDWPPEDHPRTITYFCSALAPGEPASASVDVDAEATAVLTRAREFLDRDVAALWPGAVTAAGFRWELLCDPSGASGPAHAGGAGRLASQYWRANVDPSDHYVQSLPGTDRYRLKPGASGFANLVVTGDWTDSGLNAGCVEAATRAGKQAATAVVRRVSVATASGPPP